ncbi:Rieske (2Fe-2S) protein [Halostella pelagica]|uniref:Rieske (2Fe-2S) protein n=1 Tax=Halostella pelagica TaxID=2583824 RepID=UPI001081B1A2|nr:Rieske 2Fe-2S domain-containing protein [Halostella pelagica]
MNDDDRIAAVDDVPGDGTLLCTVREGFDESEVVLTRLGRESADEDAVAAWRNYCQHWTDIRLDKGSGATMRDGEILCEKHGATFRASDGECTHGPCQGATLDSVDVTVVDGGVYLTDDRFEFDSLGPSDDVDLSSGARIDFSGN